MNIDGCCNSDWAGCQDDKRFTSGYCMFVGGNLVSYKSKKQLVVVRLMSEAECMAMTLRVVKMLWLKRLLKDRKVNHITKIKLWCDSKTAIGIANNHMQYDGTKYVKIDMFFIKKKLKSGLWS
jgi:hypothetical protein